MHSERLQKNWKNGPFGGQVAGELLQRQQVVEASASLVLHRPSIAHLPHLPCCADKRRSSVYQWVSTIVFDLLRVSVAEQISGGVQALHNLGCGHQVVQEGTNQPLKSAVTTMKGAAKPRLCSSVQQLLKPILRPC